MESLLDRINDHNDIKALDDAKMIALAKEVRAYIITCVAGNGGHLASNLGTVELTLSLLSELDPEKDKIVWDVGHQSYTYKIFTGRKQQLKMIRSEGGPSGFPSMKESLADCFGTGHASTSISAALGFAVAKRFSKAEYAVVAIIGDGALTGGMAYEAMNNAGALKEDLIVILNDNEHAISANMGSISVFLERVRFSPGRRRIESGLKQMLSGIPVVGEKLRQAGHLIKRSLKGLLLPKMLFEDMGFTYIGPLDGHNTRIVRDAIRDARKLGGPVLIHVVTKKGKGYIPAEEDPDGYHGTGPFDPVVGMKQEAGKSSFTDVFAEKIVELAAKDMRIVAVTAAMPSGTGLKPFAARFPGRFFDVGIAEQHAATFAAGLAAAGAIPVVAVYSTFLQRAYDQLVHDIAIQGLHVVFCVDRAGVVGEDGATHQGSYDIAMSTSLPNFTVLAPKDGAELSKMMEWAILKATGPVLIRYPKAPASNSAVNLGSFVPGKAEILLEGNSVALICAGSMVAAGLEAASILKERGFTPTVVDVRSIKPIDVQAIRSILETHRFVITIEEGVSRGGLFSAVSLQKGNASLAEIIPLGMPEEPILHGRRQDVLYKLGLDGIGIADLVLKLLERTPR